MPSLLAKLSRWLLLAGCWIAGARSAAALTLASLFQDHAVLQRDQVVPIWGQADAGETVTVSFQKQSVTTVAGADGRWRLNLAPLTATAEPGTLVISGHTTIRLTDILVGEVWLCSGQSNMEYPVNPVAEPPDNLHLQDQEAETAAAHFPSIRRFKVAQDVADHPRDVVTGNWTPATPAAMADFTAVGYFFAREIHGELGIPIGIIDSSVGGTPIESWIDASAFTREPAFQIVGERWNQGVAEYPGRLKKFKDDLEAWQKNEAAALAAGSEAHAAFLKANRKPKSPRPILANPATPSGLYNGMIAPVLPYAWRGVLWYQGESNAGRASEYGALFRALINQWRATRNRGAFPFYFVQLASYEVKRPTGPTWAFLREAQAQALTLPATAMAVIIDNPNPANLHPANKQDVGHRLALIAESRLYGRSGEDSGPVFRSTVRLGHALRVTFTHAGGLNSKKIPLPGFEIAGSDRVFYPAVARIDGESVIVSAPALAEPIAVRYAWANSPEACLYNAAGLPASPFRTDNW